MKFLALIAIVAAQTDCTEDDTVCADVTDYETCCPSTDDDAVSYCSDGTNADDDSTAVTCPEEEEETEGASQVVLGAAALLAAAQMF